MTDPKESRRLSDRLTRLVARSSLGGSPRVRLTLLEGDYNRAEALALRWVSDPADEPARTDALARLGRCRPDLDRARDELLKRVEQMDNELDRITPVRASMPWSGELQAVSQTASRATYFAAWANIYEGLLVGGSPGEGFRVARQGFRRLLGVGRSGSRPRTSRASRRRPPRGSRSGLAMAELSGGDARGEGGVPRPPGPKVHPTVRDWVDRWEVWALLRAGAGAEAEATARRPSTRLAPPFTPAKGSLCSRADPRACAGRRGPREHPGRPPKSQQADRLVVLGLRGLIRLGRPDLARQLLGGRDLSASAPPGALAHWLRGQAALHAAEAGRRVEGYAQAQAAFAAAQADPEAVRDEPLLDRRLSLRSGVVPLPAGRTRPARDAFRQAAEMQKAQGLPAADAEWMAIMADWSLADDPPAAPARADRGRGPALSALDTPTMPAPVALTRSSHGSAASWPTPRT